MDRSVVVVSPQDLDGPGRLHAAGARRVGVVGGPGGTSPGLERLAGGPQIEWPDRAADVVACIEPYGRLEGAERHELLAEARRVLSRNGVFVAWLPLDADLDFWTMENELGAAFDSVHIVAQIPWQGFSLAPVLDEGEAPGLGLEEGLLQEAPAATHYIAVACMGRPPPRVAEDCLLIPIPAHARAESGHRVHELQLALQRTEVELGAVRTEIDAGQAEIRRLRDELEVGSAKSVAAEARMRELELELERVETRSAATRTEEENRRREEENRLQGELGELTSGRERLEAELSGLRERVRAKETDLQVLSHTVKDQEQALVRGTEVLRAKSEDLDERQQVLDALDRRVREVDGEREELARQLEVATVEREGARQLASRMEAELDLARSRIADQSAQIAEKIEEASRAGGQAQAFREQLSAQETALQKTQSRAEKLSASAAQGEEQGRMLSEVALDRDRLREELTRRGAELTQADERLWQMREDLQGERLTTTRLSAQLEALRDQAERSRANEQAQTKEVEQLSGELRGVELERAELKALLSAKAEEVERLARDAETVSAASGDVNALHIELRERSRQLGELTTQIEQTRARETDARVRAEKRESELQEAGIDLRRLQKDVEEGGRMLRSLRSDLEVKQLEVDQMTTAIGDLQRELEEQRAHNATQDRERGGLQGRLEESAAELRLLRGQLRDAEQRVMDSSATQERRQEELDRLQRELEASSRANEELEAAMSVHDGAAGGRIATEADPSWPTEAKAMVTRLRAELAAQARQHAQELAAREPRPAPPGDPARLIRLQMELEIRAEEQEFMLAQLDGAEQKIWEMSDAADRNAARLAAGLAQLERNKERLDETLDELEVTRSLLAAAQGRVLEQERLLGSERAKLARAGLGSEGSSSEGFSSEGSMGSGRVEDLFQELNPNVNDMMDLEASGPPAANDPEPGAPQVPVEDQRPASGSRRLGGAGPTGARVVVEPIDDDDDEGWPDGDALSRPMDLRPGRDDGDEGG